MQGRVVLIATTTGLALTACQQLEQAGTYVKDKAEVAGNYVGEQFEVATITVSRWVSGRPEDDQTACYGTERVAFYDAVSEVNTAESLVFGARLAGLVGAAVTTYSNSFATRLVAAGFTLTMVALVSEIESDRTRIEQVTVTFNDLLACRRREAAALKSDVSAGRTSRSYGQEQMAQLRALVEEDLVTAREINETLRERTAEFELSTEKAKEEAKQAATTPEQAGAPPPSPEEQRERQEEIRKAEAAVQTNQKALSQQSASIEQASALPQSDAFELGMLEDPYRPGRPMAEV